MDRLQAAGLVDSSSRLSPLSNRLVVIGRADTTLVIGSPRDLSHRMIRRIALADPESVPAGKYARAWLEETGQWASISDRVVPALDVRAALWAVAGGGAEVGVVYRTDARISSRVRVLYEVPAGEGPRISYAVAAMRDRPRVEEARRVVAFLAGPAASDVYQRFGFIVVAPPAP